MYVIYVYINIYMHICMYNNNKVYYTPSKRALTNWQPTPLKLAWWARKKSIKLFYYQCLLLMLYERYLHSFIYYVVIIVIVFIVVVDIMLLILFVVVLKVTRICDGVCNVSGWGFYKQKKKQKNMWQLTCNQILLYLLRILII